MAEDSQTFQNESEDKAPARWNRFYVVLTGKTNGAHELVVRFFQSLGQTEVWSPEEADYCLVICPVATRVGVDVSEALDHLLPDKEAVLVVMHHTFNKEQVIPPSRRLVEDQRVKLTLDCLFYREELLHCQFNNNMKTTIKEFLGVSLSETAEPRRTESFTSWLPFSNIFQSKGGSDPTVGEGEPGTVEPQGASSLKVEDGTKKLSSMEKSNTHQQDDAEKSDDLKKEFVMMQQDLIKFFDKEINALKDEKEKKIQELQKDVAELKQVAGLQDKPRSSVGSVRSVGGGEPGTVEPQGASSLQVEDGTKKLSSMEVGSSVDYQKILYNLQEEIKTMKERQTFLVQEVKTLQVQNDKKEKRIQELENKLKQQDAVHVQPGSSGGSVPPNSEEEPGFMDFHWVQSEEGNMDSSNMENLNQAGSVPRTPTRGSRPDLRMSRSTMSKATGKSSRTRTTCSPQRLARRMSTKTPRRQQTRAQTRPDSHGFLS